MAAAAGSAVHTDQSTGETRHDKEEKHGTGWDPREGCGKSDPKGADVGQAPPTLTLDGRRQEGLKVDICPVVKVGFGTCVQPVVLSDSMIFLSLRLKMQLRQFDGW